MTREIKFRAWDKKNLIMRLWDWLLESDYHHQLKLFADENFVWQQSTGLKDKNGTEIWEGDVVKCFSKGGEFVYNHEIKIPEFYREIWSSKILEDGMWLPAEKMEGVKGQDICGAVEVIGDIYQNSELLK